ncbi:receptor-type tyrosine-protein phosphatase alpha-like, partial [Hyalella azteca]|uniref:Receptor-type tyrosine-protein phosphatase alpha-like n=1 Tax=Hyalella azteca TaxID=294128 RepID=A0A979FFZ9_HYAAZ
MVSEEDEPNIGLIVGLSLGIPLFLIVLGLLFYFRRQIGAFCRKEAPAKDIEFKDDNLSKVESSPSHKIESYPSGNIAQVDHRDTQMSTDADSQYEIPLPTPPPQRPPKPESYTDARPPGVSKEIIDEYNRLPKPTKKTTEASKPCNKFQNRYADVLPFEENRVKLKSGEYINASHIDGGFIATQDPQQTTEDDELFWSMVWEHQVSIIVRLSADDKNLGNKQMGCAPYLPLDRRWVFNNGIEASVKEKRQEETTHTTTTVFLEKTEGDDIGKRQVVHYHLKNWNEGNPPEPMNFLKVLKTIRERKFSSMLYENGDGNRVLVHCGAGANRSGGFIAVWKLMDDVDQNQKPNVFATVEKLRHQRMLAVQTLSMYYYVHKCIDLYVENKKIFSE